ncbi:MAG: B12-binding domain-containing radical SAM protein [Pedosphaera sp. Tous-C6FEB]|nr:MAG: B12-binding domain-containing radical SAM protein [Pedosphaera sp. Tous-C6FEB]
MPSCLRGFPLLSPSRCMPPSDILLATLNAKFIHCAFGLRYLLANLGELRSRAALVEFEIQQRPLEVVEALLARKPRIIGLGVYIWNVRETTEVVALLKRLAPETIIILGGPEVSYEPEEQEIVRLADHVITGEADLKFAEVCQHLLASPVPTLTPTLNPNPSVSADGEERLRLGVGVRLGVGEGGNAFGAGTLPKIIPAELPKLERVALPYELYTDADLAHRVLYVEASRGCPFTCEFCLSSLDIPVRQFPLDQFLAALDRLLARGAAQFKFVDRTFNLNLLVSRAILQFFLDRWRPGLFLHFEMIPDRLPEALRELLAKFPPGAVQLEIGVQTFNDETSQHISRRQDNVRLAENFQWLRSHTGAHLHADLIVGLPGEGLASFAAGFDRLVALGPQEIQVGMLKRLRGTPIVRHDGEFQMRYSPHAPYELLCNRELDFPTMQRLRRFARYWDLVANSGNFSTTTPLLWSEGDTPGKDSPGRSSPFERFFAFSEWLYARVGRRHGIALADLAEALFVYLSGPAGVPASRAAQALWEDWQRSGRRERPGFLQLHLPAEPRRTGRTDRAAVPKRQARHLAPGPGA